LRSTDPPIQEHHAARAAATAMNTYPDKIVRTERGTFPDYDLADRYRA
jgi:hypothetical protein